MQINYARLSGREFTLSLFFDGRGEFGEKWSAKWFEKGRMKMKKHCDTAGKYGIIIE